MFSMNTGTIAIARFLRDEINPLLAFRDIDTVAARALGKHDEVGGMTGARKGLQFLDAPRIQFAAFDEEADLTAQYPLDPRRVPDGFIAQHRNGDRPSAPGDRAEQDGVEQADMVADEQDSGVCARRRSAPWTRRK